MKNLKNVYPVVMLVIMLFIAGCASTKKSKTSIPNYIGQWNYVLSLPDQDIEGYLKFSQEGDAVNGVVGGQEGETPLTDFAIDEEKVSGTFEAMGYEIQLSGNFEGDVLKASMSAAGYDFPFEANKQQ
jgi:hypothetical protein